MRYYYDQASNSSIYQKLESIQHSATAQIKGALTGTCRENLYNE